MQASPALELSIPATLNQSASFHTLPFTSPFSLRVAKAGLEFLILLLPPSQKPWLS